ncbi:MAG TPA: hypothetical protein VFH51_00055 [Myxococcota bacterium]|nr:hypothetical protein [Myxococcota bacterium]
MSTQKAVKSAESRRKSKVSAARPPEESAPVVVEAQVEIHDVREAEVGAGGVEVDAAEADDGLAAAFVAAVNAPDDGTSKFREDPILDRRIIEGMLQDRNVFLEQMEAEGFSSAAVLRRAAELGLSEALIRQVKGVAADLAGERPGRRPAPSSLGARTCLSCDRVFLSSGPGNRLCMRCRGGDAGLAQL